MNNIGNDELFEYWNSQFNKETQISFLPERKMSQLIFFVELNNEIYILLSQRINPNKDYYLKLNGPGGKADYSRNECMEACVIRKCFEETEIVLRNEKLLKIFEQSYYSTQEWKADNCTQREASYIVTLAIFIYPLEELKPQHTEPETLGSWHIYKMQDVLKHRRELVPILEENIELIQEKIDTYEKEILDSTFIIEYKQQLTAQKQKAIKSKNQIETKIFLNDIDKEVPFEELPEINEENFPVMELRFEKLSSYEIQTLVKYKKKLQAIIQPLRTIEQKIQKIEKIYKGHKYLSIFEPKERQGIASKFGECPTISELSKEETIAQKFRNTRFKFEIHTNSTNKATYLKIRQAEDQTNIMETQTWEYFRQRTPNLPLI